MIKYFETTKENDRPKISLSLGLGQWAHIRVAVTVRCKRDRTRRVVIMTESGRVLLVLKSQQATNLINAIADALEAPSADVRAHNAAKYAEAGTGAQDGV